MIECKHIARQIIAMRTRGQVTSIPYEGSAPILAKASIKPPVPAEFHNDFVLSTYLNRTPGQTLDSSHLISTQRMWRTRSDLVTVARSVRFNVDFDFKRRPVRPRMIAVCGTTHLAFDTEPWTNKVDGTVARAIFDGFVRRRCLKTLEDWDEWQEFYAVRILTRQRGVKVTAEGSVGVARRMILRAYAQRAWGLLRRHSYDDLARLFTESGYPTSVTELKNAARSPLCEGVVPATPRVMNFVHTALTYLPELDLGKLFGPAEVEQARAALDAIANIGADAVFSRREECDETSTV